MFKLRFSLVLGLWFCLTVSTQAATYGGGSGTSEDPYQIRTAEQMNTIGANPADWNNCFKLMDDIDMSIYTGTQYNIIGNSTTGFSGTFDGNKHVIHNLTYSTTSNVNYIGLFGCTYRATIKDLGLENINFSTQGMHVGGLVAYGVDGTIQNCYSTGSISSSSFNAGGLVGWQHGGAITNSYNTASITALASYAATGSYESYAGGIAGQSGANITCCYSTGPISASFCAGGLVGSQGGYITYCYSTSPVTILASPPSFTSRSGGLVGSSNGTISNCYSTGQVISYATRPCAGGLVGTGYIITNCYSTGAIITNGSYNLNVGGLAGIGNNIINSFWDIQTCGLNSSAGGKGCTTEQLKHSLNYTGWNTHLQTNWTINEGIDYPRLAWENQEGIPLPVQSLNDFIPGTGSIENPYRISSSQQLNLIGLFPDEWDKAFCLENDIDLSGLMGDEYNLIGTSEFLFFSGIFDGKEHVIKNLTYTSPKILPCAGLFGYTKNATITNLSIENANLSIGNGYVGSIIGYQDLGTLTNCYSKGVIITNAPYSGGLVGRLSMGTIVNCHSTGSITSSASTIFYFGGLLGILSSGTIKNCSNASLLTFSTPTPNSTGAIGGLVGYIDYSGSMNHCCNTGLINSNSCFTGGLVGRSNGSMTYCYNTSAINSNSSYTGGLTGYNSYHTVAYCYNTGSVCSSNNTSNPSYTGGLIGYQAQGFLSNCYNNSSVESYAPASSCYVGGLLGYQSEVNMTNSYNTGSVTSSSLSDSYIGGLTGYLSNQNIIADSYSSASLSSSSSSTSYAGGLVGFQINFTTYASNIERCYSTGPISANGTSVIKGGLLGYKSDKGTVNTNCFWNTETSGQSIGVGAGISTGTIGKTTAEMMTRSTFTGAGWDFDADDGDAADWMMLREGEDYPRLAWQPVYVGDIAGLYGVDMSDFAELAEHWLNLNCLADCEEADIDQSGSVDMADLVLLSRDWTP